MKRPLLSALLGTALMLYCAAQPVPEPEQPGPTPTPAPTALPTPTPTPDPEIARPPRLHIEGHRFVTSTGEDPQLVMIAGVCCPEIPPTTWPARAGDAKPLTEDDLRGLDETEIADFAAHGADGFSVRIGWWRHNEDQGSYLWDAYAEDDRGRADLDRWNDAHWRRANWRADITHSHGMYFMLDAWDFWVSWYMDASFSPYEINVQGVHLGNPDIYSVPPDARHVRGWEKMLNELASKVDLWETGNELFKVQAYSGLEPAKWDRYIRAQITDWYESRGLPVPPIGANAWSKRAPRDDIEVRGFGLRHDSDALPATGYPLAINEDNRDMTGAYVCDQMRRARDLGTYYWPWRGGLDDEQWHVVLDCIEEVK
jgi:hypothetical protein